jgi:hypothetical protein
VRARRDGRKLTILELGFGLAGLALLAVLLLDPIQRYWLHGPLLEAEVQIDAEVGGHWRKPTSGSVEPTLLFRYVAKMPDGDHADVWLPHRVPLGTSIEIAFTRGLVTDTVFVTAVTKVETVEP